MREHVIFDFTRATIHIQLYIAHNFQYNEPIFIGYYFFIFSIYY